MKLNIIFRLCLASTLATQTIASVCRPKYPNYPLLPSNSKDISIQTTAPYGISQTFTTIPVSEPTLLTPIGSTKSIPGGIFLSESASLPGGNLPSDVSSMASVSVTIRPSLVGETTEGNPKLSWETASTSGFPSEDTLSSHETSDGLIIPSGVAKASSGGNTDEASLIVSTDTERASQELQTQTEDHSLSSGSFQTRTSSLTQDASTLLDSHSSADISPLTSEIPGSSVKTGLHGFPTDTPTSDVLGHPSGDTSLSSISTKAVTLSDELPTASEVSESSIFLPGTPPADTTDNLSGPEITVPAESSNALASGQPSGSSPSSVASLDPAEDISVSGTLTGPSSIGSDTSVVTATDISPDTTSPVVSAIGSSIPADGSDDSQTGMITP